MFDAYALLDLLLAKPEATRSDPERTLFPAVLVLVDFSNGAWLYNMSPEEGGDWSRLKQAADAIRAVGHPIIADLLERIIRIVDQPFDPSIRTWGGYLAALDPSNEIEACERAIEGHLPELQRAVTAFAANIGLP